MKPLFRVALVALLLGPAFQSLLLGDCAPDCDCMIDIECAITWGVTAPAGTDSLPSDTAISAAGTKPKQYGGKIWIELQKSDGAGGWDRIGELVEATVGGTTWFATIMPPNPPGEFAAGTYRLRVLNALFEEKKKSAEFQIYDN